MGPSTTSAAWSRAGHYLPAEVYAQIAGEVRALADRAASAPSQASTA